MLSAVEAAAEEADAEVITTTNEMAFIDDHLDQGRALMEMHGMLRGYEKAAVLLDELGVERSEDLLELDVEDIAALGQTMKKVQRKRFERELGSLIQGIMPENLKGKVETSGSPGSSQLALCAPELSLSTRLSELTSKWP